MGDDATTTTMSTNVDPINPSVPSSEGALLAEEWTIHPYSPLPSFLELPLIEKARRSMHTGASTAWDIGCERLSSNRVIPSFEEDVTTRSTHTSAASASNTRNSRMGAITELMTRWKHRWHTLQSHGIQKLVYYMQKYKAEWLCLLLYTLERHMLRISNESPALITESLYGMQRSRQQVIQKSDAKIRLWPLSSADQTRLALCYALVPYILEKLQRPTDRNRAHHYDTATTSTPITSNTSATAVMNPHYTTTTSSDTDATRVRITRKVLQSASTWIWMIWHGLDVYCKWKFLLGQSLSFDLISVLLQQVVRRKTLQDIQSTASDATICSESEHPAVSASVSINDSSSSLEDTITNADLLIFTSSPANTNAHKIMSILQRQGVWWLASAIGISWIQWMRHEWYEAQQHRRSPSPDSAEPVRVVPFPTQPVSSRSECPLCRRTPCAQPTALTTGYVYCLVCILPFVQEHGYCPVTGQKCDETNMVRLYEPRAS
jgi:hypothetical protein